MKRKEIAKEFGFSSSTLHLYRQSLKIQTSYKSNNPEKRQMTSKEPVFDSVTSNEKSKFKGGDPFYGSVLIEHTFSSPVKG